MDRILQALYSGEIFPAERYSQLIEKCRILRKEQYAHYKDFIQKLDSPLDEEFERIMDEQLDTLPLELSETFIDGFRLGARMMIEIFEDKYKIEE